jgi:AraC family transcriptional regulator
MTPPATTRLLLRTDAFELGEFRCAPAHPLWREVNDNIGPRPHLVFPQTSVYIHQRSAGRVLATPNHVVFYASHELYHREVHDPRGDLCLFVTVDPADFDQLAGGSGFPLGSSDAETYLAVHMLVRHVREGRSDQLFIEETLHRLVGRATRARVGRRRPAREATQNGHRELVEAAKDLLSRRLADAPSLGELAHDLHTSPFHLARVFRDGTGFSLHDYRIHLRLRHSLQQLELPGADLTRIAHELGFCSLSHFSGSFRRVFGLPPSQARAASRELSTIVEARLAAAS